jgi:hypothetical protein
LEGEEKVIKITPLHFTTLLWLETSYGRKGDGCNATIEGMERFEWTKGKVG